MTAVVGGNFQATAQRGSRPTEPSPLLQRQVVDLDHDAVDLEVELAAALLPETALRDHLLLGAEQLDVGVDREVVLAQPLQRFEWSSNERPSATPTW